jgi:hypothetical protein
LFGKGKNVNIELLRFRVTRKEIPVCLSDIADAESTHILREMTGAEMEAYLEFDKDRAIIQDGKVMGVTSFIGFYSTLLTRTLVNKATGKFELAEYIANLPASVQGELYEAAQHLCGLDKKKAAEPKK